MTQSYMTQLMRLNLAWHAPSFCCLANDTKIDAEGNLIGDPTETAFIQYALDKGYDVKGFLEKYPLAAHGEDKGFNASSR